MRTISGKHLKTILFWESPHAASTFSSSLSFASKKKKKDKITRRNYSLSSTLKMSSEDVQREVRDLKEKLQNYKAGSIEGQGSFMDALEGEMEGMQIRLAVFGMTGAGKSSLVNTIWKVLYGKESAPAIEQSSGAEGTQILEDFHSRSAADSELGGFVFNDTRGFNFDFNIAEESKCP